MPWIDVIDETHATGKLADTYRWIRETRGNIANIHRIHSQFPEAMRAHMELYRVLMFGDLELSRADAELIATVVSMENSCDYCASHHGDALQELRRREGEACPLPREPSEWNLDARQGALLHFATRLAQNPHAMSPEEIEALRGHGFSDRAVLETVLITSYFCFVNRIALGLGVTTSPEERAGFNY